MANSEGCFPVGTLDGSYDSVTVTGTLKVWPSGPKVIGVPTVIAVVGVVAFGVAVTLICVPAPTAPGGIETPLPSEAFTSAPVVPTVCWTAGGVEGPFVLQAESAKIRTQVSRSRM
jgi:hypothetical protein